MDDNDIPDIKRDLPEAMTMAAFAGIAWYICIELNLRLFVVFRRRRGLYFWSCLVASWGALLQPLTILMGDFEVWTNLYVSITLIYLTWWIMVIPQSLVLYSRLHLVMQNQQHLRRVLYLIMFTATCVGIPTIVLGILAQASPLNTKLTSPNNKWDETQVAIFFAQETLISILYIFQTRKHLKDSSLLDQDDSNSRQVMHHLIYSNLVVILLDISLLGIRYANYFYVQGSYKACIYGMKLRIEFAILNRLLASMKRGQSSNISSAPSAGGSGAGTSISKRTWGLSGSKKKDTGGADTFSCGSENSDVQMLPLEGARAGASREGAPYDGDGIVQTSEISIEPAHQRR